MTKEYTFYPKIIQVGGSNGFTIPSNIVDLLIMESGGKQKEQIQFKAIVSILDVEEKKNE